ncbi:hypothetical protein BOTNAR_0061g00180 [Botryotinia narcissicola]|uniref:PinX1-related protein 1 n=1 Tax=Botryotinia narcissicola TaxID=278944 RepID=A0A4Z1JBU9_9HELO|nr:hypothetical protein BOTNAR_0061g00180 [Botryotinia narcissicola]
MGLAAPKNKIKLSHDPNNTRWSGNTDSFGHRMMKSQGWTPGEYLGAKDAAHAEFHTEANASHIRVVIKYNTLGLGAKIGSGVGHGECTGLDVFQNLLGRLNGKEEAEIEKEQKGREDLKRGGVLIGDKIQDLIDGVKERLKALEIKEKAAESSSEESDSSSDEEEEEKSPYPVTEKKKSSKRKREEQEGEEKTSSKKRKKEKKEKKEKKSKKRKSEDEDDKDKSESKKSKKSKKDRKSKSKSTSELENETLDESALKARKKEKKEKKRREKEAAGADTEETTSTSKSSKKSKKDKHKSSSTSETSTKESTPIVSESSGRSTPMGIRSIRA